MDPSLQFLALGGEYLVVGKIGAGSAQGMLTSYWWERASALVFFDPRRKER